MTKIRLKGELNFELKGLGLKSGDEVFGCFCKVSKVGAFNFTVYHPSKMPIDCVVWPENYNVIHE